MIITENKIQVAKTARYFECGTFGTETQEVWFVLHGYGQLANYFLKKFEPIAAPHRYIIAPEGLARFYLDPHYSRIGASWMTSESRLDEIADHTGYLTQLFQSLLPKTKPAGCKYIAFGFSQGTATLWRWLRAAKLPFDEVVLWAGLAPTQLKAFPADPIAKANSLTQIELDDFPAYSLTLAFGEEDSIVPPEKFYRQIETLSQTYSHFRHFPYSGGHTIPSAALLELVNRF